MPVEDRVVHFVGVCGTAMGSVAMGMQRRGIRVTGSDAACYPPMSDLLAASGVELMDGFAPENLPKEADALVVIGNALSRGNPEVEEVLDRGMEYISLPEALRRFFLLGKRNFVVTGTHGKTTTTSMLAWVLRQGGLDPGFLIGGMADGLGAGAHFPDSPWMVLEGDEYDTAFFDKRSKFLHYLPEVVVINNIEFDHADIFPDLESIKTSFRRLMRVVPRGGRVFVNGDDQAACEVTTEALCPVVRVGMGEDCDLRIERVGHHPEGSSFSLGDGVFQLPMHGEFNVRNAAMTVACARHVGMPDTDIAGALARFEGVRRRQQERGCRRGVRVIDDFAHHPTAIRQAIAGMRQKHPRARVWAIFEPRSNTTRRRTFQDDLAAALGTADLVVVAEVEDSSKIPEAERLDTARLLDTLRRVRGDAWVECGPEAIVARVAPLARDGDVLLVMSNGGFGGVHDKLLSAL